MSRGVGSAIRYSSDLALNTPQSMTTLDGQRGRLDKTKGSTKAINVAAGSAGG